MILSRFSWNRQNFELCFDKIKWLEKWSVRIFLPSIFSQIICVILRIKFFFFFFHTNTHLYSHSQTSAHAKTNTAANTKKEISCENLWTLFGLRRNWNSPVFKCWKEKEKMFSNTRNFYEYARLMYGKTLPNTNAHSIRTHDNKNTDTFQLFQFLFLSRALPFYRLEKYFPFAVENLVAWREEKIMCWRRNERDRSEGKKKIEKNAEKKEATRANLIISIFFFFFFRKNTLAAALPNVVLRIDNDCLK